MEYSLEAVAKKMIFVIVCASAVIALGGYIFYQSADAMPFAIGVMMAMGVNIIKVLWLKKTVNNAADMQVKSAKRHTQIQVFLRLVLTAGVFLAAGLLHSTHVNLIGTALGIFSLPIASYSMHFFFKNHHSNILKEAEVHAYQDAIDEINTIVTEKETKAADL